MWPICGDRQESSSGVSKREEIGRRWSNWQEMNERGRWLKKVKDGGEEYTVDLV